MPVDLTVGPPPAPEVQATAASTDDRLGDDLDLEHLPDIDPSVVKGLLRSMGGGLQYVVGNEDVPNHWRFTDNELDDITPPLTRMINRRPRWKQAVMRGDEATVAIALAGYVGRNVQSDRAAKEKANAGQPSQAERAAGGAGTGAPQPPGGPWGGRVDGGGPGGPPGRSVA